MARPRAKDSERSLGGLGLNPKEDLELQKIIDRHDISIKQLVRRLVRQCIEEGGEGLLKHSTVKGK